MSQATTAATQQSGGLGFTGALTIAFIVLKLVGTIGWSWWWVLSPILISFGVFAAFLAVIGIAFLVAYLVDR